jgi:Reverse transcriptase (RNA-dependent DNA polymerase)
MESKAVWKIVPLSSMPPGRKLVGNRWVYTEKDDGTNRSRMVAQGFSQVPGKDLADSNATVMTDLAFRLALIIRVLKKPRTGKFDIETGFLYSELDQDIYMRLPDGYVKYMLEVHKVKIDPSMHVILLNKAIYGFIQAARQWWKKFKEVLATCDYYLSKSDPCLFIKKTADREPISFVIIYVDDGGIIGAPDSMTEVIGLCWLSYH